MSQTPEVQNLTPAFDAVADKCIPCNIHEVLAKAICEMPQQIKGECPICWEDMNMVNLTITRCGHTFHSSCLIEANMTLDNCPLCRVQLLPDNPSNDDDDSDAEYEDDREDDDDDDSTSDHDSIESVIEGITVEQLAAKLTNMGYSNVDLVRLLIGYKQYTVATENHDRYTPDFIHQLDDDVNGILNKDIPLVARDTRTYAQVIRNGL
jgi:hypothetical protein